jgi:hypothetical protein
MVNADRVKRKLPSLLIDGETTDKRHWAAHNRVVYQLQQLKKRNPQKFNTLTNKLLMVLEEFERAVSAN